ncbi:MAG: helix-turn-helix transcriptional regulator [Candidatus Eisenbacteria bacterium]|uniref:Helix-turn-helix transcriptional regulator n=1 Tax=Eiseniibacteriota bacterium TaxID=2212470 RepID=A0A933SHQ7_UNCEI|nr:helix-turn-helix transcriptional regulator [Candidatus Eisenbacteria bacterium]
MNEDAPRKRGRPSRPTTNAMGQYLRSLREERGLTVRELARAVGLPESSASYISQLEAGLKAPNPELAVVLGQQLRDRQGIFRLWALTSPRANDPRTVAMALRELSRLLGDPSIAPDSLFDDYRRTRIEHAGESLAARRIPPPDDTFDEPAIARLSRSEEPAFAAFALERRHDGGDVRIPFVIEDVLLHSHVGEDLLDPHTLEHYSNRTLRLDAASARTLPLHGAFACEVTDRLRARVSQLLRSGDVIVFTREVLPIVPQDVYLVRSRRQHGLVLSLVMHNGEELLLLPDQGRSDFEVMPARSPHELRELLIAHVARVIRYPR